MFANYHGVNVPIVTDFKLLRFNKQLANFLIFDIWLLRAGTGSSSITLFTTEGVPANLLSHKGVEMREMAINALDWSASALLHPRKFSDLHRYS